MDKLDDIVNKYNNTYHRTIKMKLVDVKPSAYVDFSKKNHRKSYIYVGDYVRISKFNKIFAKGYPGDKY